MCEHRLWEDLVLPTPPVAPKGRLVPHLSDLLKPRQFDSKALLNLGVPLPKNRDPHGFYWREKPQDSVSECSLSCEDFRHRVESEKFQIVVQVPSDRESIDGALRVRVTAANLPDPVTVTFPIRARTVEGNIESEIRRRFLPGS